LTYAPRQLSPCCVLKYGMRNAGQYLWQFIQVARNGIVDFECIFFFVRGEIDGFIDVLRCLKNKLFYTMRLFSMVAPSDHYYGKV
jgi:hypothetical protein